MGRTEELYYKAKWISKYGLPWVKHYGNPNTRNIAKFLDCEIEAVQEIAMNGRKAATNE